ncbi:MAG: acyl-CoA dehydrogenase family protein, partial [Proteobacteria bacterium]|nr:acyl-CoA dehydrogenase family protein [Pseudomonadota bacterium]
QHHCPHAGPAEGVVMLILDEDQELLQTSAKDVLEAESPIARFRELRDAGELTDTKLWAELAELGWPAIPFTEAQGGLGWGLPEAVIVLEQMGRTLALTPMLSVLLGGSLDPDAESISGKVVALAWQESREPELLQIETRFKNRTLSGIKRGVLDGMAAEELIVSAWDGDKLALFRVNASDADRRPLHRIDHRDAADIHFDGVRAERLPGGANELRTALHAGVVGLSAEMLGGSRAALRSTLAFIKERVQFDRPIGSFQALQHRIVDAYIAVELLHSAVLSASRDPSRANVALVKATANETYMRVAKEAIQLHGGIGVTDESDIGFFIKRAMVASQTLGTTRYWRDQWAREHGY